MFSTNHSTRIHASSFSPPDLNYVSLTFITALQPTSIVNLKVTVNKGVARKCGGLVDIYQGEVLVNDAGIAVPRVVAIKRIRCDPGDVATKQEILSALRGEEGRWPQLSHPNLCPLWQLSSPTEDILAVGMPWLRNGNVLDFIRLNSGADRLALVLQVASAIKYIHAMDIIHGNIVPNNIMIADDGSALLADVGLNACLSKAKYNGTWSVPSGWMFKAAEELQYECDPTSFVHTKAMDVCAFANTVHTIYTLKPPYPAQPYGGIVELMSRGHVHVRPAKITEPLWHLLQLCRSYRSEDRPSMVAVEAILAKM